MNTSTLFKLRTLVGVFLILGMGSLAHGQALGQASCYEFTYKSCMATGLKEDKACDLRAKSCAGNAITTGCDADYAKVREAHGKFTSTCAKATLGATVDCTSKAQACQEELETEDVEEPGMFSSLINSLGDDEASTQRCPVVTGTTRQANVKDIGRELKDAQKSARELEKKIIEDAAKNKEKMADLNTKLAELEQKKGQDEGSLSQKQTEEKAKASQAMNDAQNSLLELNTAILNAQTKKAQAEAKKAEELAGLSQALISMNCEAEIKNALAKGGKQKAGSAANLIRARGIQKKATEESFRQCIQAMLAKRKGVIATYDGAIKGLDDEMNKNMTRIDQVQASLKQMETAAAQQATLMQKEGTDAEKKYWTDRAILYQQIADLSEATQAGQYQSNQELAELKAEVTKQTNRLALAEKNPVSNTETTDTAMAAASAYVSELAPFIKQCCKAGASYDACSWKKNGTQSGGGTDSSAEGVK